MGMSLPSFIAMWSLMMPAMMFPSVAPLASRYTRMIRSRRWFGLMSFATGYLAVWGASGGLAF
jgi:predicted metal-binding membrane protein